MKRFLPALFGVALCACSASKQPTIAPEQFAGTTFSGTLPCTDCEGIKQVVTLNKDNSFRLTETYLGKQEQKEKTGNWALQNGKLMLFSGNAPLAQYTVNTGNLVYFNPENKTPNSAMPDGTLVRKKYIRSKKIDPNYLEGIDVVAFGSDASWSLDINHNKAIQFSLPGMEAPFAVSPVVPKLVGDSLVYDVVTNNERMRIVFSPGLCGDNSGESLYDYKVSVSFRGKTFNGCGTILNADGTLNGTWLLESFEGHANNWEDQPFISVNMGTEKFFGFTGCNSFSGSTRLKDLRVCFSDINAAARECGGFNETAFIDALVKCNGFTINQGLLELTQDGKRMMTFRRKLDDQAGK